MALVADFLALLIVGDKLGSAQLGREVLIGAMLLSAYNLARAPRANFALVWASQFSLRQRASWIGGSGKAYAKL